MPIGAALLLDAPVVSYRQVHTLPKVNEIELQAEIGIGTKKDDP